jgi:sialic acid synthase SpsE
MENYLNLIKNIVSEFRTNKIFVLGKGPSVGKIKKSLLKDGIVININDSERFYPGQFCLVHSLWALESIKANGYQAKCYFSSRWLPDNICGEQLPYEPETFDSAEKNLLNIDTGCLSISDFLFISAIELALIIADLIGEKMDVYFLGFDFYSSESKVIEDFSDHSPEYTEIVLKSQESIFKHIKNYFEGHPKIRLIHVGNRQFSDISVINFNTTGKKLEETDLNKINKERYDELISKIEDHNPIVVAELTNNHIGDESRLRAMVRLAKDAGADAIKVQKRDVNNFYTKEELNSYYHSPFGNTLRDYRERVELNDYLFGVLIEECIKNEIFWYTSILDMNSFEYIRKFDLPLIKLPSTISDHRNFIKSLGETYLNDIVVSTGFTDLEYEKFILQTFTNNRRLFLLQCTSSYPTPPEACQVSVVRHYSELRNEKYNNLIPGYSSHDVGSVASMLAVAAGALMIEKHVKLGNLDWVHFDGVALDLTTNEFKNFVHDVRKAVTICGTKYKDISPVEDHKYKINSRNN